MTCEKCWEDAYKQTVGTGKSQGERYYELLEERKETPCTPQEQAGQWWDAKNKIDKRLITTKAMKLSEETGSTFREDYKNFWELLNSPIEGVNSDGEPEMISLSEFDDDLADEINRVYELQVFKNKALEAERDELKEMLRKTSIDVWKSGSGTWTAGTGVEWTPTEEEVKLIQEIKT